MDKDWLDKLRSGDRVALARAITLCESTLPAKQELGFELLNEAYPFTGNSIRIGITGTPGAGKSTFIESFGLYLLDQGHKVAVLAVDPSSSISKGSILGDKTRMERLSIQENAFIRPSPSGSTLGGLSARTAESILFCEAAGYDVILIETVGVGQSETLVKDVSDIFVMIAQPSAGDELQGIKRGIMEMTDLVVVNKDDGSLAKNAALTYGQIKSSIGLFPPAYHGIPKEVVRVSAIEHRGMDRVYDRIISFMASLKESGSLEYWRARNEEARFENYSKELSWNWLQSQDEFKKLWKEQLNQIKNKESYAYKAALSLFQKLKK